MIRTATSLIILILAISLNAKSFTNNEARILCLRNNLTEIKKRIKSGYDINGKIRYSSSTHFTYLLHIAIIFHNGDSRKLPIIVWLVNNGVNLNLQNKKGETALHLAIQNKNLKIVEILLKHGADIHIKDNDNNTALHFAAWKRNFSIIKLLLKNGANNNVWNARQQRPFDYEYLNSKITIRYISTDPYLHKYFSTHPILRNDYNKALRKNKSKPRKRKNKAFTVLNVIKNITLPPLYIGTSLYLREKVYKNNPKDNHFGTFNAIAGPMTLGILTGGYFGAFLSDLPIFPRGGSSLKRYILGFIIGGTIGGIIGGMTGYIYREEFKNNRGLYYSASAVICIPILYFNF